MSEMQSGAGATAGSLLRTARERQGLHIAALATAIKVSPRKLDALENDRYDELPDATFTRALAQTVCRTLKIDAGPVLALLPHADLGSLENVAGSLNTPFRERPGREETGWAASAVRPLIWASGALMLAALVVQFLPDSLWEQSQPAVAPAAPAAPAPSAPDLVFAPAPAGSAAAADTIVTEPAGAASAAPASITPMPAVASPSALGKETLPAVQSAPAPSLAAPMAPTTLTAPPSSSGPAGKLVQLRTREPSWIEVQDGRGQLLISRVVQPAEGVGLDGVPPLRVIIGNASATQIVFRDQPVDLAASTRDNVARLELK